MSKVGFIGLGTMGAHMARNVMKAGHELVFFARRKEVIEDFQGAGATYAESPAEVARQCEFVITIVTADLQVEDVALGRGGIVEGAGEGKVLIDMSTIGPDTTLRVGRRLSEAGMSMVDAPVSGGPWGAEAGSLTIMVGATDEDFARVKDLLETMGDNIFHVGPPGAGQTVKLINQMIGGAIMSLIGEGFVLAKKAGVDLEKFADVVGVSSGNSAVFQARGKKFVLADRYEPAGFRCDLMHKDLRLAIELGQRLDVPTPVAAAALQQFTSALNQGHAAEDFSAVVRVSEQDAGVRIAEKSG